MTANEHSDGRTFEIGTNPIGLHRRELLTRSLAAALAASVGWGDRDSIAADLPLERDRFLDLSAKLCGMPIEGGSLADVIQNALAAQYANEEFRRLTELVQYANPQDVERLGAGLEVGELAKSIVSVWYSGQIGVAERTSVLAYDEALAWRATGYAKAPGVCGAFGDWIAKPHNALDDESSR
ncbi:MAG TPA: sugar dehydrogenase complex small subunit [Casimicrobiaceae bacterium]|nr:sugar dehydrogenase complex small subunit [Casimicrobiaceae bacterium]